MPKYVCIGQRFTTQGRLATFFQNVEDPEDRPGWKRTGWITTRWPGTLKPGGLFEIELEQGMPKGDIVFVGRWEDGDQIANWEAEDLAAKTEYRQRQQARNDMARSEIRRLLEPLKTTYFSLNRTGRRAMLAMILEEMTS